MPVSVRPASLADMVRATRITADEAKASADRAQEIAEAAYRTYQLASVSANLAADSARRAEAFDAAAASALAASMDTERAADVLLERPCKTLKTCEKP